jgi:hypothetical protein
MLTSTAPWGEHRCDDAVQRGAHESAHLDRRFVFEEMRDFCLQGYWTMLPYDAVRHWPSLRLSPIGAVPQRNQRPRLIVDYSFSYIHKETVQLAPPEAMQFGRTLQRVLKRVVQAGQRYGPVYLAKIDIADGLYRVWLRLSDISKLGVVLPTSPGQPGLIAFPLTLPMRVESPLFYCPHGDSMRPRQPKLACARHRTAHTLDSPPAGGSGRHTSPRRR